MRKMEHGLVRLFAKSLTGKKGRAKIIAWVCIWCVHVCACVSVHMCANVHTMTHVWRLEDNLQAWVISFHHVVMMALR